MLSIRKIEYLVAEYNLIGLFSHLDEAQKAVATRKAMEDEVASAAQLLACFSGVVVPFEDGESGNIENPYEELTLALAYASRGVFTPLQVLDTFAKDIEKTTTVYGFDLNGRQYRTRLKVEGDWLDSGFFDLIAKAIAEHHADGRFYHCVGGFIFLSDSQYEYLEEKHPALFSGREQENDDLFEDDDLFALTEDDFFDEDELRV